MPRTSTTFTVAEADENTWCPEWPDLPALAQAARPPFPLEALSELHRDFVVSVAESHNVPVDVPAMQSLAVLSTAAAKKATVAIDFQQPQNLAIWIVVVLRSGEGKSGSTDDVTRPLERAQQRIVTETRETIVRIDIQRRMLALRLSHLNGVAARTADESLRGLRLQEAQEVATQILGLGEKHTPKLIVGDITPEALVDLLAKNDGHLAMLSDEGHELFGGLKRRGNEQVDHLLKAYSGTRINVDRKASPSLTVLDPALTIGVSVQPQVLRDLVREHGSTGRGFLGRFLFSFPEPLALRTQDQSGLDPESQRDYAATVNRLLELPIYHRGLVDGAEPPLLVIDGGPGDAMRVFAAEIDARSRGDGDLSAMFEWVSKLRGNVAKLAALLHLYDTPTGLEPGRRIKISPATVERAIMIGRYCLAHAQVAYGVGTLVGDDDLRTVLAWIKRHGQLQFRMRDLHRGVQHRFPTVDGLRRVLTPMIEDGYIRPASREAGRLGRPGTNYDVHPVVLGRHDTMTETIRCEVQPEYSEIAKIDLPPHSGNVSSVGEVQAELSDLSPMPPCSSAESFMETEVDIGTPIPPATPGFATPLSDEAYFLTTFSPFKDEV